MTTMLLSALGALLSSLVVTAEVMPQGDFNLQGVAGKCADGSCWRMNHLAEKTNLLGKLIFKSERWNNENDMCVVDVKYCEYALIHTIKTEGVSTVLNKLYARGTDLSPGLLQKFRQFSLDTGILPENIAIFPQNDECPAA